MCPSLSVPILGAIANLETHTDDDDGRVGESPNCGVEALNEEGGLFMARHLRKNGRTILARLSLLSVTNVETLGLDVGLSMCTCVCVCV